MTSRFAGPQFAPPPYSYENQTVHPASPQMYVPPPGQYGWVPQGDVFYPPPQYGTLFCLSWKKDGFWGWALPFVLTKFRNSTIYCPIATFYFSFGMSLGDHTHLDF